MHKSTPSLRLAAVAAALLLSACGSSQSQQAAAPPSNDAAMDEKAPVTTTPVVLPPSLAESQTYRCKDNSLVYIDFMTDNVSANLRTKKEGEITKITAPAAGQPFTGGGYTVSGSGKDVTITQPGKPSQACNG